MLTASRHVPAAYHVLVKPTGAVCNLDCKYCFFLSKELLYPGSRFRMADDLLETYIKQLLESHRSPEIVVAWQGGEPTLMGLPFFQRSIEYVRRHRRPGQHVSYTIQTNGTRLDDRWCAFFKRNQFLVGLSIDGPREMHDAYRVDKGGAGTFDDVMRAWKLLRSHGVDTNILCALHAANQDHPLQVYRFFRDTLGAAFIQFIPIVERATPETLPLANRGWSERPGPAPQPGAGRPLYTVAGNLVTDRSVSPDKYGRFLIAIFDEWVRRDVGRVFVQHFDAALANWAGVTPPVCIFSETCGNALALEHNGDLYSCDHFVEPRWKLGNIKETHMIELVASPRQVKFGLDKRDTLPRYCRQCPVRFACHGECPRNRFLETPDGEPGLNYLCDGYKAFFTHIDGPMRTMAALIRSGRYADEIMSLPAVEGPA